MDAYTARRSLNTCPECRYSLRELPECHACPECGFSYDTATRVWRPLAPRSVFGGLSGFAVGTVSMVVNGRNAWGPWSGAVLVLWIACGLGVLCWCLVVYRQGSYVSVGPDGVRIRLQRLSTRFIPWEDVVAVIPQRYDRMCRLVRHQGRDVPVQGVFRSSTEVLEFAQLAADYAFSG